MGTIATLRNYIISKQFSRYFNRVFVLSVKNVIYPTKDNFDDNHIERIKVNNFDYRNFKKNKDVKFYDQNNPLVNFFSKLFDSFPFNFLLGEGGIIYIVSGYISAKKVIESGDISHIYSSFRPFADHWIARLLKRKYPHLIWIADYRDVHVDPVRKNVFFPKIQHWYNKRMLKNVDVVTTVSEGLADILRKYDKEVYVLHNGIFRLFNNQSVEKNKYFNICYTGSMYGDNRNPSILLKALNELIAEDKINPPDVKIKYAGKDDLVWQEYVQKYKLSNLYEYNGYLSFEESFKVQRSSHINLLLTYASKSYTGGLTGKLYEYFSADRPILLIIKGDKDKELEEMFTKTNAGLIVYTDNSYLESVKQFINNLYSEWKLNGSIDFKMNKEAIEKYHWDKMMDEFVNHLRQN